MERNGQNDSEGNSLKPYYQHGGITIYHADSRELLSELDGIEACVTDPPYGISLNTRTQSTGRGRHANKGFRGHDLVRDFAPIRGDDEPFDPAFLLGFKSVIMWGAIHYANKLPVNARWLIWDKRCGSPSDDNADCEVAWTNLTGQARVFSQYWRGWLREGEENLSINGRKLHPAQKPARLMRWCLTFVPESQLICDPYMGSGTTLLAAKTLNRRAIGIELDESYCETAAQRLSQDVFSFDGADSETSSKTDSENTQEVLP